MAISMMENGRMARDMEWALTHITMATAIKAIGPMAKRMEKE